MLEKLFKKIAEFAVPPSVRSLQARHEQLDREMAETLEELRINQDVLEWQQLERLDMVFKLGWHYGRSGAPLAESRRASTVAEIVEGGKRRLLKPVKTS